MRNGRGNEDEDEDQDGAFAAVAPRALTPAGRRSQYGQSEKEVPDMQSRLLRSDGAVAYVVRNLWTQDALYLEDRAYVQEHRLTPKPAPAPPAPKPIPTF